MRFAHVKAISPCSYGMFLWGLYGEVDSINKDAGMRLSYESGYVYDVHVPYGKTAVMFLVEGGHAVCHVYRQDDLGARWVWIESKSTRIHGPTITMDVSGGWWIRTKIEPLVDQQGMQTTATVSFYPLR
jgi:hypothetical protein